MDPPLCSRVYNDESSLGLTGINWVFIYISEIYMMQLFGQPTKQLTIMLHGSVQTDTLGPFDLGLPLRKVVSGDSISHSGFG